MITAHLFTYSTVHLLVWPSYYNPADHRLSFAPARPRLRPSSHKPAGNRPGEPQATARGMFLFPPAWG